MFDENNVQDLTEVSMLGNELSDDELMLAAGGRPTSVEIKIYEGGKLVDHQIIILE